MTTKTRKERVLVGFDTEDDGHGTPFLFCFTHARGRAHFTTRHEALAWIEAFAGRCKLEGKRLEVWATNLEYDLCNLFPNDRLSEITFRFGRSALCGARWRGAEFRDTMRHVPASVAELGELVGLRKVEERMFDPGEKRTAERYLRRCQRDASITYRAARRFASSYEAFGEHARMTLASTALAVWERSFWKRRISRPSREVWTAAFEAYHGGRTQAFAVGSFEDVKVADVASMYPWAMTSSPLPLPWGLYARVYDVEPEVIADLGIYDVTVRSELPVPRLPVRTDVGTTFPNGRWRAWYVGEELNAFRRAGGLIERVHRGIVFSETCRPFDEYVFTMFAKKQAARGIERTMYKLLLNGLYGKFGQRGRTTHAVTVDKFIAMSPRPEGAREWNGLVIYQQDGSPPPWSNMVWPAFVTARARVRLADEIERVHHEGGRVFYCDTDSMIYTGPTTYPERARAIGGFETRGTYRSVLIVGKKEYALELGRGRWDAHVKGVPEAERFTYLVTGETRFSRPTRLREAGRANVPVNVWREVVKKRRTIVSSPFPDGGVTVPRLGDRGRAGTSRKRS